ncbi:M43 family zinc metalloprotease [Kribbella sp. CA-293567]|uniref:M43 family zinc metalloprotease n=1 Tax=Kribbella sp. CA-293567 TaxID=3002436 RepID=UPI0022DE5CE6|nr:M43 family zinc metalloprotease [Kribbella sp. CA-293567]WBQ03255.1 M43 family zinc metalloprotease [Kribbella sp. CA-293567]
MPRKANGRADRNERGAGDQMPGGAMPAGAGPSANGAAGMPASGGGAAGMTGGGETQQPSRRQCGVMDVHRRLLSTSAEYVAARSALENATTQYVANDQRFNGIAQIQVVVHVVWNTAAQNISQAQIDSQLDVLNRDFRATNTDLGIVPAPFTGLVADSRIEFRLASTDPAGNPTTGVTRTQTSRTSFGTDDAIKASATGGIDPWPAERYLNIWVGQLGGGLLGYAQFPGGPAETDGVVVLHSGFGTNGTAAAPFDLGRTTTHEIGHYLNLFHIWGDDGSGCSGSDEVADTPNQGGPNFGVPAFPKLSCSNGPHGDLFVNYMDYTDDRGMVMFTHDQVSRMEACLDTVRTELDQASGSGTTQPTPAGPVVSWDAHRIDAFVLGTDRATYHKWWDGAAWGPSVGGYEYLGGVCMSAPEVASWGPDRLDAFVLGTDRGLYHKWWDGTAWGPSDTGYEALGGICMSPPRVASWGPGRLDVFVLGTDRALYHKWWDGTAWNGFEHLGGICMSPPEVVAWGPDRLDVFVLGTDNAVYHKWWDGTAWNGFEYLGGICAGPPTAVAWGPDRLDLFVIGTDSALYHKWYDGTAWSADWENLGGICVSAPTVVSWDADRLDVFVVGTDSALYHQWWDGTSWSGFESLGGICIGEPRVTAWGADRLDVFVAGTDGGMYHKWWDGTAWGPSITGYEALGGVISDFKLDQPVPDQLPSTVPEQVPDQMPMTTTRQAVLN